MVTCPSSIHICLWRWCVLSCCAAAAAKSLQSCPTLCDPMDGSPAGSPVPGILQARTLEWAAISFSNACMHAKSLRSCWLCTTPWTAAHQAPLSTRLSRQEYWSGLPFPSLLSCSVMSSSLDPWTVAHQAYLALGFPKQEHWSGLPFPSPGSFRPRDRTCISCVSYNVGGFSPAELWEKLYICV